MRIGILTAMDKEFELVSSYVTGREDVVLRASGIGKVNAAVSAYKLIEEEGVDLILNTGCAGAVDPSLNIGDVVIGTSFAYHDVWCGTGNERGQVQGLPANFFADPESLDLLQDTFGGDGTVHFGMVCSGDSFIETAEDDAKVKAVRPDALVCDMEAAAIAQVCYLRDIPFIAYKLVSDSHGDVDRTYASYGNFWDRLAGKSFSVTEQILSALCK